MAHPDAALQSSVLQALRGAHNYRRWLCELALPWLGDDPLELGSGLGDHAQEWLDAGIGRITISDIDAARADGLRARFARDERVQIASIDLMNPAPRGHSSVVAFNVLEHIADDVAALRAARELVRPTGAVVMFVPAIPAAMSDFDRRIGHCRRYTRASLAASFRAAGLSVVQLDYVNAPGLVAWFVGVRVLGLTPTDGVLLAAWDRLVVPVARTVESRLRPPIGQSLFAVGRVPNRSEASWRGEG